MWDQGMIPFVFGVLLSPGCSSTTSYVLESARQEGAAILACSPNPSDKRRNWVFAASNLDLSNS